MEGLFDAIRSTVDAAIKGDGSKLGTSIVDIVTKGAEVASDLISKATGQ
ncbi:MULTISPECIES: beta-class phenol-soluble modulin [Staphylococcus]|uniref:Beta-class phenol-soluble modulin n=1 Tax=Staphylococcus hsinchuensis TaxID=3051183 RepID=A0ABZ3EAJ4_9STAP|nr:MULTISPECIES: beta-class phenol-soluble modulin [unclassified Staphylococcus]